MKKTDICRTYETFILLFNKSFFGDTLYNLQMSETVPLFTTHLNTI